MNILAGFGNIGMTGARAMGTSILPNHAKIFMNIFGSNLCVVINDLRVIKIKFLMAVDGTHLFCLSSTLFK